MSSVSCKNKAKACLKKDVLSRIWVPSKPGPWIPQELCSQRRAKSVKVAEKGYVLLLNWTVFLYELGEVLVGAPEDWAAGVGPTPRTRVRGKSPARKDGRKEMGPSPTDYTPPARVLLTSGCHRRCRDPNLANVARTPPGRTDTLFAVDLPGSDCPSRPRQRPSQCLESAVPGERPRGRGLGPFRTISSHRGQSGRGGPPGRNATWRVPARTQRWRASRKQCSARGSEPIPWKDGSTNECFATAHTPKREFEGAWGRGGQTCRLAESMLCSKSRKWRARHAQ